MSRIALFGGAFDPPHLGHQALTAQLLERSDLDQVWWVPAPVHAFGKHMASWEHRLEMCQLAVQGFAVERVRVSEVERDLPSPQHTVDTVTRLQARHPEHRFAVVMGSDNLDELERWKNIDRLRELVSFVVVPRAGHDPTAVLPQVASSQIRARLRAGEPVANLLDRAVADYIARQGLYGEEAST